MSGLTDFGWSAASAGLDAALGFASSRSAARQEYKYAKKMYQHRYQWQMKDMQAAGLNPMLAFSQGAPVPDSPNVHPSTTGVETGIRAFSAKKQANLLNEQTNLTRATANKEAAIGEQQEMQNAITRSSYEYQAATKDEVDRGFKGTSAASTERWQATQRKLVAEADSAETAAKTAGVNLQRAENDYEREKALRPLVVAHQEYVNKGLKLGLSEKEADAQFYEMLGGWAKGSGLMAEAVKLYMMYLKLKGSQ